MRVGVELGCCSGHAVCFGRIRDVLGTVGADRETAEAARHVACEGVEHPAGYAYGEKGVGNSIENVRRKMNEGMSRTLDAHRASSRSFDGDVITL